MRGQAVGDQQRMLIDAQNKRNISGSVVRCLFHSNKAIFQDNVSVTFKESLVRCKKQIMKFVLLVIFVNYQTSVQVTL